MKSVRGEAGPGEKTTYICRNKLSLWGESQPLQGECASYELLPDGHLQLTSLHLGWHTKSSTLLFLTSPSSSLLCLSPDPSLFSAAGDTVTLKRASLRNFEKVQPEGSQVDGTKEEDYCTCSMSLILMNEINWICPFTSCITHPILYSIAVKMKY